MGQSSSWRLLRNPRNKRGKRIVPPPHRLISSQCDKKSEWHSDETVGTDDYYEIKEFRNYLRSVLQNDKTKRYNG